MTMNIFLEAKCEIRDLSPNKHACFSIMSGTFYWRISFLNRANNVFFHLTLGLTLTETSMGFWILISMFIKLFSSWDIQLHDAGKTWPTLTQPDSQIQSNFISWTSRKQITGKQSQHKKNEEKQMNFFFKYYFLSSYVSHVSFLPSCPPSPIE